ncbi:MAG TPA: hypothetical protein VFH02_02555 [Jiangellaceae bacterium]|jgi:hypothetical protein|nr:hypothetical protein [Jiangellaceae bacterium]
MRNYAEALTKSSGRSFWELFDITGLSKQRGADVGAKFNDLYVVDERIVDLFQTLLKAAKTALRDVADTLGSPGSAEPANVSAAARVLGEYADEFRQVEQSAQDLARELEDEILALSRP